MIIFEGLVYDDKRRNVAEALTCLGGDSFILLLDAYI